MRNDADAPLSRYLAEWYNPHLRGRNVADVARRVRQSLAAMIDEPNRPELLCAVQLPQDAYTFGLFSADSVDVVTEACKQAGVPADRVTAALEAPADTDGLPHR
jgi:hypothetical protein